MNTTKLALRGLMRNRRRSVVTLLAIAFGFAAISLFAGYTHNVYDGMARQSFMANCWTDLEQTRHEQGRQA